MRAILAAMLLSLPWIAGCSRDAAEAGAADTGADAIRMPSVTVTGDDSAVDELNWRPPSVELTTEDVAGEKVTRAIERAIKLKCPCVVVCASGGARMQEGILSLMQMAKTSAALAKLRAAGLPYIAVLTNPTMAGVMASYATLGDVIVAEPGALIGFAGARVIKETTNQDLPEGFQSSEFLLKRGLIDMIIHRKEMKSKLASLLRALAHRKVKVKAVKSRA